MPDLPKRQKSSQTADIGVNLVSQVINDSMGWLFRRNPLEFDYGIDGYIDIIEADGSVTGKSIAVQIKTGESYFRRDSNGDIVFYGENRHLNYYANLDVPVILILHNPACDLTIWISFDLDKIETTKNGWKCWFSENQKLDIRCKDRLRKLVADTVDFHSVVQNNSQVNSKILDSDFILYAISREDINSMSVKNFLSFIQRIEKNRPLARHCQGKIEITVSGYDFDQRELWEIDEVRRWFQEITKQIDSWFYFLGSKLKGNGIKLIFSCMYIPLKILDRPKNNTGKIRLEYEPRDFAKFFEYGFHGLNKLTDELDISVDENKRISFEIMDLFGISHD